VRASCHACAHKAIIPKATLQHGRPNYTRLVSLERQLRSRISVLGPFERKIA
jgi:hypothetical protein